MEILVSCIDGDSIPLFTQGLGESRENVVRFEAGGDCLLPSCSVTDLTNDSLLREEERLALKLLFCLIRRGLAICLVLGIEGSSMLVPTLPTDVQLTVVVRVILPDADEDLQEAVNGSCVDEHAVFVNEPEPLV